MTRVRSPDLIRALRAAPGTRTADLLARLGGIDRSTLTRALKTLGPDVVSRGGSRRTAYALRRTIRGASGSFPLYRIDEAGRINEIGVLDAIQPYGSALATQDFRWPLDDSMRDGWFEGLPYPIYDMRPQGFLGRHFAQRHALDLGVSTNPLDWNDDDILHVLSLQGADLPGDLILGETALKRHLAIRRDGIADALHEADIDSAYPRIAAEAMQHGVAGSSAGGEFPKFTVRLGAGNETHHCIVKFSGSEDSAAVRRWTDLLVCEHRALQALGGIDGLRVARSRILFSAGRCFLEIERFDRHGEWGRSPVCTLASVEAGLLGMAGARWAAMAEQLQRHGWLDEQEMKRVALIECFGRLIANTDMHTGNLAFRPGLDIAPLYDMLPMAYAPSRSGELPQHRFSPALPLPAERETWQSALQAAIPYWQGCAEDTRITDGFRAICAENAQILVRQQTLV